MNEFNLTCLPARLRERPPAWGIVLGSGLGTLVHQLEEPTVVDYSEFPGLPVSKVPGHAGRFIFGNLGGRPVVLASGRVHLYEGYSAKELTAGVRCLAAMGVSQLILTNAAGTLNPGFEPGSWMMLSDHLNLTGTSSLLGTANFLDLSDVYSAELRRRFAAVAKRDQMTLHEGVYAGLPGPQYETPAEVRMLRGLGADAVGMSTVLEAIAARALGLEVAAFSCLANWAAGLGRMPLSHRDVLKEGEAAAARLSELLVKTLAGL